MIRGSICTRSDGARAHPRTELSCRHEPVHLGHRSADGGFILFFSRKGIAQFRRLKVLETCAQVVQRFRKRLVDRGGEGFRGRGVIVVVQTVSDAGKAKQAQSKNKEQFLLVMLSFINNLKRR